MATLSMNPVYLLGYTLFKGMGKTLFHLKLINREKLIDNGTSCIYVCNHQSFLDPPLLSSIFENPVHFLARKTLFDHWFMKWALPLCNALPIDQKRPDPGSILKVLRHVRAGGSIVIFPEGARCPDGEIHDAMPGIGLILSKLAGVPVQPLRIDGAYEALPIHSSRLRCHPISISVGDPIEFTPEELHPRGREGHLKLGKKIMDAIRALPTHP